MMGLFIKISIKILEKWELFLKINCLARTFYCAHAIVEKGYMVKKEFNKRLFLNPLDIFNNSVGTTLIFLKKSKQKSNLFFFMLFHC